MTQNERYAVVVVTHNRKELLKECIRSIESQTVSASNVIIVNNASNDGTNEYLNALKVKCKDINYDIVELGQNIGGAGGFAKGMDIALKKSVNCVLLIDDDAVLDSRYMEQVLMARRDNIEYKAFAGTVMVNGVIDVNHRRNISKYGMLLKECSRENYENKTFVCDIASFCGMVVNTDIIKNIGLPHAEYFIYDDDLEYSLRINEYSRFLVVPSAFLNHKVKTVVEKYRRYGWKDYYGIRNRLLVIDEHGNAVDKLIGAIYIFWNFAFRNWLFSVFRVDRYDWKYEKETVKRAIKDYKMMRKGLRCGL